MTKKERILEILSRKEASTPVKDALLDAARKTEAFARSREGMGSIAGGIGGGTLAALLSKGSRKKRLRDILLGLGIGGAGGYAASKYVHPSTGAVKETYDPVADGANPSIVGEAEAQKASTPVDPKKVSPESGAVKETYDPVMDGANPSIVGEAEAQKASTPVDPAKFSPESINAYAIRDAIRSRAQRAEAQKAEWIRSRQEAGQRVSKALAEQGRRQASRGGLAEFGAQIFKPGGYEEALGTTGNAIANTASKAKASIVGGAGRAGDSINRTYNALGSSVKDLGQGTVDLGRMLRDSMRKRRDVFTGKTLPPDVQAEYDSLLKRK